MKIFLVIYLLLFQAATLAASEPSSTQPLRYEIPRTEIISITNSQTKTQSKLYVKRPKNYSENKKKTYPVIYFTDPKLHIEILSASTEMLMGDVLLVGIEETEGTQYSDEALFTHFINHNVIPFIEKKYRTKSMARTYFGYSAGALFGAHILAEAPDTFQNYLLGSPAFKWNLPGKKKIFELGSHPDKNQKALNANVFISYGTQEPESGEHIEAFVNMLKSRRDKTTRADLFIIEGDHLTAFPMTGVKSVEWLAKNTD